MRGKVKFYSVPAGGLSRAHCSRPAYVSVPVPHLRFPEHTGRSQNHGIARRESVGYQNWERPLSPTPAFSLPGAACLQPRKCGPRRARLHVRKSSRDAPATQGRQPGTKTWAVEVGQARHKPTLNKTKTSLGERGGGNADRRYRFRLSSVVPRPANGTCLCEPRPKISQLDERCAVTGHYKMT